MSDLIVSRRRFLHASGGLLLGTLMFTTGPIALIAPSQSWALEMHTLSSTLGSQLLLIVRRIYPHDTMEDAVYAFAVKALDQRAAKDPSVTPLLLKGFARLDEKSAAGWMKLAEAEQVRLLVEIQTAISSSWSKVLPSTRSTAMNWPTSILATKALRSRRVAT